MSAHLQMVERAPATTQDMCLLSYSQAWQYRHEIESRAEKIPDFLNYYTLEWLWEQIATNHIQVWTVGTDLIIMTRVLTYPKCSILQVFGAEGTDAMHHLEVIWEVFSRFAVLYNCPRIEVIGRSGWARVCRRLSGLTVDREYAVFSFPVKVTKGH